MVQKNKNKQTYGSFVSAICYDLKVTLFFIYMQLKINERMLVKLNEKANVLHQITSNLLTALNLVT